jgi:hypothetical protein
MRTSEVNFNNILVAAFVPILLRQKITRPASDRFHDSSKVKLYAAYWNNAKNK